MGYSTTKIAAAIIGVSFLACCAGTGDKARISEQERAETRMIMESFSQDVLLEYIKELTSDNYAGRLSGTREYKACAEWVASLFEKWGLKAAGEKKSFLQSYPNPYTIVFVGGELSYSYKSRGRWRKKKYVYEKEYYPGSQSGDGKRTAEVVYAGYGITAPELDYDDYAEVNVRGKIVLVEPDVPVSPENNPELYKEWRPYALPQYKIKMAVAQGARGMLINDLRVNPNIDYVKGFMVAQVGKAVLADIFAGTGNNHEKVRKDIQTRLKPQSFRTRKTFTIENFTEHHKRGIGYNVLGLLEGTDSRLKEEVIFLGANLDHCGFCYEVIPGANDNASGVAVMLGLAEALSKSPAKLKRSILFAAFGSKEQAHRGAEAYLAQPAFPRKKTVALINLDMVGCGDKLHVLASNSNPERLRYLLKANEATADLAVNVSPYAGIRRSVFDADLFLDKKIPSTILRVQGSPTFPHTTRDTVQTITPQILEGLARLLYRAVSDMADSGEYFFPLNDG